MSSISEQIRATLKSRLIAAGLTHVYRSRQSAFAVEEGIATTIEPVTDPYASLIGGNKQQVLTVNIISVGRGAEPDSVLDPRLTAIADCLRADVRLGGLAVNIEGPDTDWDFDSADGDACIATQTFRITYRTPTANSSAVA